MENDEEQTTKRSSWSSVVHDVSETADLDLNRIASEQAVGDSDADRARRSSSRLNLNNHAIETASAWAATARPAAVAASTKAKKSSHESHQDRLRRQAAFAVPAGISTAVSAPPSLQGTQWSSNRTTQNSIETAVTSARSLQESPGILLGRSSSLAHLSPRNRGSTIMRGLAPSFSSNTHDNASSSNTHTISHAGQPHSSDYYGDLEQGSIGASSPFTGWTTVTINTSDPGGTPPCQRSLHSAAVVRDTLYVMGGYDGQARLNDFYSFSFTEMRWSPVISVNTGVPGQQPPSPRDRHVSVAYEDTFYVFGEYF